MYKNLGVIVYSGPSRLTSHPIVGIITNFSTSDNSKTGHMLQFHILTTRSHPSHAIRSGFDEDVCGQCPMRPTPLPNPDYQLSSRKKAQLGLRPRTCYPNIMPENRVYRVYQGGKYTDLSSNRMRAMDHLATYAPSIDLRLGTYGDPAAIPRVWWREWFDYRDIIHPTLHHTGYTHQWKEMKLADRLFYQRFLMASCDNAADYDLAVSQGWRTFTVSASPPSPTSILCPASKEAGHRTICAQCLLCDGNRSDGLSIDKRKHIYIPLHGSRAKVIKEVVV